jgi:apolipoprotein N-acyltransferase
LPCAFVLHLAFPRADLPWLAPLALGGLFAVWMRLSIRAAAGVGFLAGVAFFAFDFSWFGETAGALLGPFGFLLDLAPALVEALAFAVSAACCALAARQLRGASLPFAVAAGFTLTEALRSSGLLGVPLYQIGAAFVDTPVAPLAAFGGVYLLTFVVALAAAGIAAFAIERDRRAAALRLGTILAAIAMAAACANLTWPARTPSVATVRVAAVQGNIRQSVKWQPQSLARAVERYTSLTESVRGFAPQFVLWPETVVTTDLQLDAALAAVPENAGLVAQDAQLNARFSALAKSLGAVVAVGSIESTVAAPYNDLFFFTPDARPRSLYRKRQLVPFAEFLPGPAWLRALPFAALVSDFKSGTRSDPLDARLHIAPLICWDADFTGLAQEQAAAGASFFAIATDDAWFGESDGPYAQAQLAQLRAIETGRWIVRAAATGISGVIAPNGRWQARSDLDTVTVVRGTIGPPQPTVYSRLGPGPVGAALVVVLIAACGLGRRRQA